MDYVEGLIFAVQSKQLRNVLNRYIKTKLGNNFICSNEFIHNPFSISSMNQITWVEKINGTEITTFRHSQEFFSTIPTTCSLFDQWFGIYREKELP